MSQDNKKAPGEGASLDNGGAAVAIGNLTTESPPLSTIEKAIWLHSDLVGFYHDKCAASLGDEPVYLKSFEGLQLALGCTDSLLSLLNRLLWGTAGNG